MCKKLLIFMSILDFIIEHDNWIEFRQGQYDLGLETMEFLY